MKQPKTKKHLIRRFLPYYRKYRWFVALDLFCAILTTLCELILPLIVKKITNVVETDLQALTVTLIVQCGLLYLILRIIDAAAYYYMSATGHIIGTRMETDMRRDFFSHLQKLSFSYYDNAKVGKLMSRLTSDLFDVTEFAHHCPEEFLIAGIKIICSFIILFSMNPYLTLIVFAVIPPMTIILTLFNHKVREGFRDSRKQVGALNAQIEDSLLGVRVVKSFANEHIEEEKFNEGNQSYLSIKRRVYHVMGGFHSTTRFFDGLMYIVVVVAGAFFLRSGGINASDYIAYLMYVSTLLASIRRIVEFAEQFQRGITGIERFFEIMDIDPDITDRPDARKIESVQGAVSFQDVSFCYGEGLENVLSHLNLEVKAGERIALVGPSGGGKTTLCSLIPRFYDATNGTIRIDGVDVRDVTLHSLRNHIGVVAQDVYLFSGSIRENILYGKTDATEEEIIEAAKNAGAHDFILSLPNGYDTYVGERGVKLSGGQKQRISIARVFLKNPPILILDEATSALDNESEHLVQQSLERLTKGRTTFTIAHRLTTIRNADRILVLTEDGIAESGTHAELIAKGGIYYDLYQLYTTL
jgi:ATP-binding cassette subfamily B protein